MKALCKGGKVSLRFTHLQRQYADACIGIRHEIWADIPNECFSRHFDRGIVGIRKALPVVRRFQIPVERLRSLREYTYQKPVDIFVFIGGKGQSPFRRRTMCSRSRRQPYPQTTSVSLLGSIPIRDKRKRRSSGCLTGRNICALIRKSLILFYITIIEHYIRDIQAK